MKVPLVVSVLGSLFTLCAILQQVVEEVNRENLDLLEVFKCWNGDMLTLSDVEEDAIQKEKKSLDIEVLAPRKTQIEKELR